MKVKLPALLGNHDRPTDHQTNRPTDQQIFTSNKAVHLPSFCYVKLKVSASQKNVFKAGKDRQTDLVNFRKVAFM